MGMDYRKINLRELLECNISPCDIYIKLSDKKYLKLYNEDTIVESSEIYKYLNQGVKDFYISGEDVLEWQKTMTFEMKRNLSTNIKLQEEEDNDKNEARLLNAFTKVRELAFEAGMEKELVSLVQKIQDETVSEIKKKNISFKIINNLLKTKSYNSTLSLFAATLCCAASLKMSWSSKETMNKFIMAALFHDITITSDELSKIRILEELDDSFTAEQKTEFITHPEAAFEIFKSLGFRSASAGQIILSHHELPDGSGFPNGLRAATIPQYVCLFILSEEVARTLIENNFNNKGWEILKNRIYNYFDHGNFRKPIQGLVKLFPDKLSKNK